MRRFILCLTLAALLIAPFTASAATFTAEWGQSISMPDTWTGAGPGVYISIYDANYFYTLKPDETLLGLSVIDPNNPNSSADDAFLTLISALEGLLADGTLPWYRYHNLEEYQDEPFYTQIMNLPPLQRMLPAMQVIGFTETVEAIIGRYKAAQSAASTDTPVQSALNGVSLLSAATPSDATPTDKAAASARPWDDPAQKDRFNANGRYDRDNLVFDNRPLYDDNVQAAIDAVRTFFSDNKNGSYVGEPNAYNRVVNSRIPSVWEGQKVLVNTITMHLPFSTLNPKMVGEVYNNFTFRLFPDDATQTWVLVRQDEMSIELLNKVQYFDDLPIPDVRMMRNSPWAASSADVKKNEPALTQDKHDPNHWFVYGGTLYNAPVIKTDYYFDNDRLYSRVFTVANPCAATRDYFFSSMVIRYGAPNSYHDTDTTLWNIPGQATIMHTDDVNHVYTMTFFDMVNEKSIDHIMWMMDVPDAMTGSTLKIPNY